MGSLIRYQRKHEGPITVSYWQMYEILRQIKSQLDINIMNEVQEAEETSSVSLQACQFKHERNCSVDEELAPSSQSSLQIIRLLPRGTLTL